MRNTRNGLLIASIAALLTACGGTETPALPSMPEASQVMVRTMQKQSSQVTPPTVTVAGYRSNYTITNLHGVVTLTNKIDGVAKTYTNVTMIKFVDVETSLDLNSTEAQVYRLYQAAFNRAPDVAGLGFWIQAVRDGKTLTDVATGFQDSDEFRKMYGNADNRAYVTKVYQNVLHRDPEDGGLTWWVNVLNAGTSRANAMTGFSESNENKSNLKAAMEHGFDSIPFYKPAGTPLLPKASSYENKMVAFAQMGPQADIAGSVAYADFFRDGTYSMVVNGNVYDRTDIRTASQYGAIKFMQKINGQWVDSTSKLLSDTTGCLHPRKAIVADFNADGKADVFFACHGFDADPFPGEQQRILLSQDDGTYKNTKTAFNCFCHGASAADVNGDNFPDILVADQMIEKTPYFLINNKDGTFTKDTTRLPAFHNKGIWTAELIDAYQTGKYDAFLAGADVRGAGDYELAPTIFRNVNGNFKGAKFEIPMVVSQVAHYGNGAVLDIVVSKNNVYLLRTFDYKAMSIQKTNLSTGLSHEVHAHSDIYAGAISPWFSWITLYQGKVVSTVADYKVAVDD